MFDVDEGFQREIGIFNMPDEPKQKLIDGIKQMINDRILIKLSDQITEEKAAELEKITNDNTAAMQWLSANAPNYATSEEFAHFKANIDPNSNVDTMFAINKWFLVNLPSYPAVLAQTINEVKEEIKTINGK